MSIRIDHEKCIGCGRCTEVCPGNLLYLKDIPGYKRPKSCSHCVKDCWGCTACIKVCPTQAIQFYLGADVGGRGSLLTVQKKGDKNLWKICRVNGEIETVEVNTKAANKY